MNVSVILNWHKNSCNEGVIHLFIKAKAMKPNIKKLSFLLMSFCLGGAAIAGPVGSTRAERHKKVEGQIKRDNMEDLRDDIRNHRAAAHVVNHDLSHVRFGKAIHDHKAVARINKQTTIDAKRLELMGVDHPVAKAKRQVKVQDDNRKDNM